MSDTETQTDGVASVAPRIPQISEWCHDIEHFFVIVEAQFLSRPDHSDEATKYSHLVCSLDRAAVKAAKDVITPPDQTNHSQK